MEPTQNPDSRTKLLLEPELNLEPLKKKQSPSSSSKISWIFLNVAK